MCAFPKRKLNVQFWDFPKIAAFWENPEKIGQILQKISKILAKFATFCKKSAKNSAVFNEKLRLETDPTRTVQRSAFCRSRRELVPFSQSSFRTR